jgi:MFS family permease
VSAAAALLVGLDMLVVATALSTIRVDLGASLEQLEWTVNAYVLSFAVLMMTAAALGDRFGRRRLFVAGLGLFAAASVACAVAPDAGWLIALALAPSLDETQVPADAESARSSLLPLWTSRS